MNRQAFHFGTGDRQLFGVLHPAAGRTRGLVVCCPPLLHEQMRSYRFFSQLAARLAADGLACLRFDYHGSGDSAGEDADFSPDAAPDEIAIAAAELRRRAGDYPLVVLGVRGSALFACRAAQRVRADGLWLWQPVCDGREYVEALDARYRHELRSRERYPARKLPVPTGADDLMGFAVSSQFRRSLSNCRISADAALPPVTIIADAADLAPGFPQARRHVLPAAATAWADEIDLHSLIHLRDAEPVVQALLRDFSGAGLPSARAHG